jgi:hypothetical protein
MRKIEQVFKELPAILFLAQRMYYRDTYSGARVSKTRASQVLIIDF